MILKITLRADQTHSAAASPAQEREVGRLSWRPRLTPALPLTPEYLDMNCASPGTGAGHRILSETYVNQFTQEPEAPTPYGNRKGVLYDPSSPHQHADNLRSNGCDLWADPQPDGS